MVEVSIDLDEVVKMKLWDQCVDIIKDDVQEAMHSAVALQESQRLRECNP